ncbi:MAG: methyltransferase [Pseudomonadota bacterium]
MSYTPAELDWDRLVLMAGGHTAFQLLWAGVELGLYDKLSAQPGQTLDQLAQSMGLARQPARILLIGLTALGVIKLENSGYFNAKLTEDRMVSGMPGCIAPILGWQAHIVYPGMVDFVASLKENRNVGLDRFGGSEPTLYERLTHDKRLEKIFQDSMSGLSRQANRFLPKAMDFSRYRHVVDAGGGDGTNAMAIARAYPDLKTSVFDSASVCAHARQNIAQAGMSGRVGTWEGNFFDTPFPPDADCVVYCHILTIWSMDKNRALLKRTFDALPEGGAVVIFNMMGDDDDRGPLTTALGSPYFLAIATGEGMLHPWKDYEGALRDVGFKQTVRLDQGLPLDHGILVGIK